MMAIEQRWRSRITRHAVVDPATLTANPANWRRHPKHQADALAALLADVGYVQSVMVNERSGRLVDGLLRVELAVARGEPGIPVTYVDLDDDEERLVLATLDPLAAWAETDGASLRALLDGVSSSDDALGSLLGSLAESVALPVEPEPPSEFPEYGEDIETEHRCPKCGYEWSGATS
jgi:ParB-like chromosome segregation protein Spo0J